MNDKIKKIKFVTRTTARIGTGVILKQALENNVNCETKIEKITVCVAAFVIAGMAKDAVGATTDARVDEIVNFFNGIKAVKKEAQEIVKETQPVE